MNNVLNFECDNGKSSPGGDFCLRHYPKWGQMRDQYVFNCIQVICTYRVERRNVFAHVKT